MPKYTGLNFVEKPQKAISNAPPRPPRKDSIDALSKKTVGIEFKSGRKSNLYGRYSNEPERNYPANSNPIKPMKQKKKKK